MRRALEKMKEAVRSVVERGDRGRENARELEEVGTLFEAACAATVAFEEAEGELQSMRASQTTSSKLGALLKTRNLKLGDVVRAWDTDGNGSVDPAEFRQHVKGMGFKAPDDDIDEVFQELDGDGSGELDLEELKVALKKLQDDAAAWVSRDTSMVKSVASAKKAAKAAQSAAQRARVECEARHVAGEAAAKRAKAEAKAAAEAKAKAEREAAAAKKAAEAARRQSNAGGLVQLTG